MTDIPNTEYITVKRNKYHFVDICVADQRTEYYRGQKLYQPNYMIENLFNWLCKQNPKVLELHVMSSKTPGKFAEIGKPVSEHGLNVWGRVKFNDGILGPWVCENPFHTEDKCAANLLPFFAYYVHEDDRFIKSLFSQHLESIQQLKINPVVVAVNNEAQIKR